MSQNVIHERYPYLHQVSVADIGNGCKKTNWQRQETKELLSEGLGHVALVSGSDGGDICDRGGMAPGRRSRQSHSWCGGRRVALMGLKTLIRSEYSGIFMGRCALGHLTDVSSVEINWLAGGNQNTTLCVCQSTMGCIPLVVSRWWREIANCIDSVGPQKKTLCVPGEWM